MDHNKHHPGENKKDQSNMGMRGVTRPMAEQQMREHNQKMHEDDNHQPGENQEDKHSQHQMMMSDDERRQMLNMHHMQTLWVYWMIVLLGAWLILSPLTFDYGIGTVQPSGGRSVWLSLDQRILAMKWSDIISGVLLLILLFYRDLAHHGTAAFLGTNRRCLSERYPGGGSDYLPYHSDSRHAQHDYVHENGA
jgi:hypothetical protein